MKFAIFTRRKIILVWKRRPIFLEKIAKKKLPTVVSIESHGFRCKGTKFKKNLAASIAKY